MMMKDSDIQNFIEAYKMNLFCKERYGRLFSDMNDVDREKAIETYKEFKSLAKVEKI